MRTLRSPRPITAVATALFVVVCAWLGCWQLDRGREKEALLDGFRNGDATVVDVTSRALAGLPRYQAVRARGTFEPRRQILLDNMTSVDGRPGYRVLTPFRRAAADALLLVDRGWMPLGQSRERLPRVDTVDDSREITGRIDRLPTPGLRMRGHAGVGPTAWPRVMNFPASEELADALGERIEPDIVLLDPAEPDGYERKWQPTLRMNPARHLAYAIQWFAFGIVAVIVLVVLSLRRDRPRDGETR